MLLQSVDQVVSELPTLQSKLSTIGKYLASSTVSIKPAAGQLVSPSGPISDIFGPWIPHVESGMVSGIKVWSNVIEGLFLKLIVVPARTKSSHRHSCLHSQVESSSGWNCKKMEKICHCHLRGGWQAREAVCYSWKRWTKLAFQPSLWRDWQVTNSIFFPCFTILTFSCRLMDQLRKDIYYVADKPTPDPTGLTGRIVLSLIQHI